MSTSQKKYSECLNDLMDYFILSDIYKLSEYQSNRNLSRNLLDEFTSNESGDEAVSLGIITPIRGVMNFPYTVYFSYRCESAFSCLRSRVQHHKRGYILEICNGKVFLLTMPLLRNWSEDIYDIVLKRPHFSLEKGWYEVEIVCGETLQDGEWEPTFEFIFHSSQGKPDMNGDIHHMFKVESASY